MKKTITLNHNLGHINTSQLPNPADHINEGKPREKEVASSVPLNICNEIVDALVEQRNVYPLLVQINHLLHFGLPLSARPDVLKELNKILGALFYQYRTDHSLFKQAHEVMTLVNKQIDRKPQKDSHLAELEWEELQKTVYLLCDWEDIIKSSSARTLQTNIDSHQ
ncbi:MAG: hypothetical protein ACD_62C00197G0003 [uncultured bacterium]|nr:MAG: hypothetical protein ACD_62C00197G0003 [uncultured bacterium]HLD45946.1 hypothetical protein [bacterium]